MSFKRFSSAAPASAFSAGVYVHVCRTCMTARVDTQPPYELGVLQFHYLDRQPDHPTVDRAVTSVAVCIDGHVSRIAVLMLAVLRGTANTAVMVRRAETRLHIERQTDFAAGLAMPARELADHQLDLVEQARAHSGVAWPRFLAVVIQEIGHTQMSADSNVDIPLGDLEKPLRRRLFSLEFFREISADAVAVQHRPFLL